MGLFDGGDFTLPGFSDLIGSFLNGGSGGYSLGGGGDVTTPAPTPTPAKSDFNYGSLLTAAIPAAITGAGSYMSNAGAGQRADAQLAATAAENEKNRLAEMEMLKLKLAAAGGGGGGGGGGGADPRVLYQNALFNQGKTKLEGAQLPIGALARMVDAIQRGVLGR